MCSAAEFLPPLRPVLIVEASQPRQRLLLALLDFAGLRGVIAPNGSDAFEAWRAERWSLILMNMEAALLDGPALTQVVRRIEGQEGREPTPVIGYGAPEGRAAALAAGMDDHLAWPFNAAHLFEAVEARLGVGVGPQVAPRATAARPIH